jgi:hypothetical protein
MRVNSPGSGYFEGALTPAGGVEAGDAEREGADSEGCDAGAEEGAECVISALEKEGPEYAGSALDCSTGSGTKLVATEASGSAAGGVSLGVSTVAAPLSEVASTWVASTEAASRGNDVNCAAGISASAGAG